MCAVYCPCSRECLYCVGGVFTTRHYTNPHLSCLTLLCVKNHQHSLTHTLTFLMPPPRVGHPPVFPLSIYFLIFCFFLLFPFFIGFTYFVLLSIPFISTRKVPLRFQAGGHRRRPNLGLVCFVCVICIP